MDIEAKRLEVQDIIRAIGPTAASFSLHGYPTIDTKGLRPAAVLAALHNAATCTVAEVVDHTWDEEEAGYELRTNLTQKRFGMRTRRSLFLNLHNPDSFDCLDYDLYNGAGSAAVVIGSLRKFDQDPDNPIIQSLRRLGYLGGKEQPAQMLSYANGHKTSSSTRRLQTV